MSVYVDPLVDYGWRLGPSCHMLADTDEELRAFAARIGMKPEWYQRKPHDPCGHFDLVASRRTKAVALGAIELSAREMRDFRLRKRGWTLGEDGRWKSPRGVVV